MTVVSHYRLFDVIGESESAVVYHAEDLALGREVALKFLAPQYSSDYGRIVRLQHEARTLSTLNHPNICTVYEIGEHEGRHFIAMEFLEGQVLSKLLAVQPLTTGRFVELTLQIAAALDAAHAQQIVHRDLKPANIFVTRRDQVKLLDFGLALLLPNGAPSIGTGAPISSIGGTGPYMSPEQIRREDLDTRTDLFSLGVVMYEMVSGARPFTGATAPEVMDAIATQSPTPVRELNPAVPAEIERIIDKALEKPPKLRYQTASDLCADLERVKRDLDTASVVAARVSALAQEPARPLPRRRTVDVGAAGALLAAAAVTAAGVFLGRSAAHRPAEPLASRPIESPLAFPLSVAPTLPLAVAPTLGDGSAAGKPTGPEATPGTPAVEPTAAHEELAIARQKIALGLYDQALDSLHRTVDAAAGSGEAIDALFLIASVHETRGEVDEAMSTYLEIAGRFPSDAHAPEALYRMALVTLSSKRQERESEARHLLSEVAEKYPSSAWAPRALMARAEIEERLNLWEGDKQLGRGVPSSLVTYREVVQRYQSSDLAETARVRLARAYLTVRQFAEAAAAFEAVAARDRDNRYDAWFTAGEIFEKQLDDPDRARRAYARVPPSSPKYREAQKRLGK
jgi:TolA-binding protein/predicted Ser/Thr protein kinase